MANVKVTYNPKNKTADKRAPTPEPTKKNNKALIIISSVTAVILIIAIIVGVVVTNAKKYDSYVQIKFGDMYTVTGGGEKSVSSKYEALNGEKVWMQGFMAPDSSASGRILYIVRTARQTCPFCQGTYVEAMPALYSNNKEIKWQTGLVKIYGTLDVGIKKDTDGYDTPFRIYIDKIETV